MRWRRLAAALVVLAAGCGAPTHVASPRTGEGDPGPAAAAPSTRPDRASAKAIKSSKAATTSTATRVSASATGVLTLITEPDQGMTPIDRFLAEPRHSLDMTMYELVDSKAESILASDAARGVSVRVILDRNREGSANTPAYAFLAAHGVHVEWAPPSFAATHEKAVVIDAGRAGAEALILSLNLTSRYYATTRDFAVLDPIPADVAAVETVFDADFADRSLAAPSGADLVWSPGSQPALVALIDSARRSLEVENEEMGSAAVIDALTTAARRGVDVEVTMTTDDDWDAAFGELRAAGVHVHLYPDTATALYIHAKVIVVDGRRAFVGSENFSEASLDENRELGLVTAAPTIVAGLGRVLAADYAGAAATGSATAPVTVVAPPSSSCRPLTDGGKCYEPGEYCRDDDHGASGIAGDGEAITCEDRDGTWEWTTA